MRAERDQEDKLYEATFYCSLLLSAPSQREAIKRAMEVARKNHLKIGRRFQRRTACLPSPSKWNAI